MLHWVQQPPVVHIKVEEGTEDPHCSREPHVPIKQEPIAENNNDPSHIKIEEIVEVKQEPSLALQEDVSHTFCNYGTTPNVPVMQMLLDAHLSKGISNSSEELVSGKIIVPLTQSALPNQQNPNQIFHMQIKKLAKKTPQQGTAVSSTLPSSPCVINRLKQGIVNQKSKSQQESQKEKCKYVMPCKTAVVQNGLDAGKRLILLSVEKLSKDPLLSSEKQHLINKNTAPTVKSCDPFRENSGDILVQPHKAKTFSSISGPPMDVCSSETSAQSFKSIKSCMREATSSKAVRKIIIIPKRASSTENGLMETRVASESKNFSTENNIGEQMGVRLGNSPKAWNYTSVKLPSELPKNVEKHKRNLTGSMEEIRKYDLPSKTAVIQNGPDAGKKIILLRVEKLSKASSLAPENQNQIKENTTPNVKCCDQFSGNRGIMVQTQQAKTFSSLSGAPIEVCSNVTSASRAPSIMSSDTRRPDINLHKIRRLKNRVSCLENLLYKLIDAKYVPFEVKKHIQKTLRSTF